MIGPILVLAGLTLFFVPLKHRLVRNFKTHASIACLLALFVVWTPEKAWMGAPFLTFGKDKISLLSCNYEISTIATFCEDEALECSCKNINALATMAHCYTLAFPDQIDYFRGQCKAEYNITISRKEFDRAHQFYLDHAVQVAAEAASISTSPVLLNDSQTLLFRDAFDQFLGNYDRSAHYSHLLIYYWAVVLTVVSIGNWSKLLFPGVYRQLVDPTTNWFRKSLTLPAAYGPKKTNEKRLGGIFDMLVPTRAETAILSGFTVLTTALLFYNIHFFEGDPVFPSKTSAMLRYHAVRSGILASAMMPYLILFGGRNNFLQWVTRWDYSTFITLHRWISRVLVILFMIHGTCYSLLFASRKEWKEPYIIAGLIAILSGVVILIQGLLVLRRKYYEAFLIIHIVLAFAFVVGGWYHVLDLYYIWFYYVSAMIWLFDRVVRVGRLVSFGFPNAKVYLLEELTLKVVVPKPEEWDAIPGGHAFIHFLSPAYFWQSHPFTYTITDTDIVLFMKVKEGVTLSLYRDLLRNQSEYATVRVAIEGSYGETTPAINYDSAIFIAGGNGIPGIYAEVLDLYKHCKYTRKNLKLVWVVRDYKSLLWFYEELKELKSTTIETTIYTTQKTVLPEVRAKLTEEEPLLGKNLPKYVNVRLTSYNEVNGLEDIKADLDHITFKEGRPAIGALVRQSVKESLGSSCFVTCGHPVMVDDIRAAVVNNIENDEKKRVDYFEQLQVWA